MNTKCTSVRILLTQDNSTNLVITLLQCVNIAIVNFVMMQGKLISCNINEAQENGACVCTT